MLGRARRTRSAGRSPRGGSQAIADALASYLRSLGGEIETGRARDVARRARRRARRAPRRDARGSSSRSPATGCRRATAGALERFRYGPGVFKLDWALDGPIPWTRGGVRARRRPSISAARSRRSPRPSARRGAAATPSGRTSSSPSRACSTRRARPTGKHTAWAYCHVPNGSDVDMTERIEAQVERFAPGLPRADPRPLGDRARRDSRRTTRTTSAATSTAARRPAPAVHAAGRPPRPVHDAAAGRLLCSSSTPPGGGVHGMCGYHAARAALRHLERRGAQSRPG